MTRSLRALTERRAALLRQCAAQRDEVSREVQRIRAPLDGVDRVIATLDRWLPVPLLLAAGIGLVLVMGRSRSLRMISIGAGMISTALRVAGTVRRRVAAHHRDVPDVTGPEPDTGQRTAG